MKSGRTKRWFTLLIATCCVCGAAMSVSATSAGASVACSAKSMITIENSSNRVLYEHNADQKLPMASTTKIVTAITVIERCENLEKMIKVPAIAVGVEGSSIYLEKDEPLRIIDLLYGLMLQSGNDCAVALAVTTAGSVEKFADWMNETAASVGATNSHFVTPHGLHDDDHYTTARDLALITSHAMKNKLFEQIVSTKRYTMPWQGRNYNRVVLNKNKLLSNFEGADGVKTGFTKKAGRCLVSSATRNGMRVISVVLNDGPMFEDCSALMNRAFSEYTLTQLAPTAVCARTKVIEGKCAEVGLVATETFYYPLRAGEAESVKVECSAVDYLLAPVEKGLEAGKFSITLDNQLLFEGKLYTINMVDGFGVWDNTKRLIEDF